MWDRGWETNPIYENQEDEPSEAMTFASQGSEYLFRYDAFFPSSTLCSDCQHAMTIDLQPILAFQ